MEKFLIYIKHHFGFIWQVIEWINGVLFLLFYKSRLEKILPGVFKDCVVPPYSYRRLDLPDANLLYNLIHSQKDSDLEYFKPHGFDLDSLRKLFTNRSYFIMGAFDKENLAGYFFLRFFANKKCFVGRLIDKDYRGSGMGSVMNKIMYELAWRMQFRCLSTISRNNTAVMCAHAKNPSMIILKELPNDYLLVEFVKYSSAAGKN
jgi:hypothetical protein